MANLEQLAEQLKQAQQTHQAQLKQINLLFDKKCQNYEVIEFAGLYALLEQFVKER